MAQEWQRNLKELRKENEMIKKIILLIVMGFIIFFSEMSYAKEKLFELSAGGNENEMIYVWGNEFKEIIKSFL